VVAYCTSSRTTRMRATVTFGLALGSPLFRQRNAMFRWHEYPSDWHPMTWCILWLTIHSKCVLCLLPTIRNRLLSCTLIEKLSSFGVFNPTASRSSARAACSFTLFWKPFPFYTSVPPDGYHTSIDELVWRLASRSTTITPSNGSFGH